MWPKGLTASHLYIKDKHLEIDTTPHLQPQAVITAFYERYELDQFHIFSIIEQLFKGLTKEQQKNAILTLQEKCKD